MNKEELKELVEELSAKLSPETKELLKVSMDDYQEKSDKALADALKEIKEDSDAKNVTIEELKTAIEDQGGILNTIKDSGAYGESEQVQITKFLTENLDKIKSMKAEGSGFIEFTTKAVGAITVASAALPVAAPAIVGVQTAPPTNVNLREAYARSLTTSFNTNQRAYAYTQTEPKEGGYAFVAEGIAKSEIDFKIETRYAPPEKVAAWTKLTDEAVEDIPNLTSIANDYLRKQHNLKDQDGILFGTGVSPIPKGSTVYGRVFSAGAMALKVPTPNFSDVINACVTDIFTTHNYTDEGAYMANLCLIHPETFFTEIVAAKDTNGSPLFPSASLFNRVVLGGVLVIPERSIPVAKIHVADMSKYNTTNYIPYHVKVGWVNDDFIKNQFVILGESRSHYFVKDLDEQAFIYDDHATIKTAITLP